MAKKIPIMKIIPRKDKQNTVQIIAKNKKINFNNDQTGYSHLKVRSIQNIGTPYIEIYTENPELGIPSEEYLEKNYLDRLSVNSVQLDSEFVFDYPNIEGSENRHKKIATTLEIALEENKKLKKEVEDYDTFFDTFNPENNGAQEKLNQIEKENLELKTTIHNHNKTVNNSNYSKNGFFGHMSNVADKLDKFESENPDYNKFLSEDRTLDRFLDEARSIGMIEENDGAEKLLNYLSDYDLESEEEIGNKLINSPLYKEKNNEKIKEHNQAKNSREVILKLIKGYENNDDSLESVKNNIIETYNDEIKNIDKIIGDYESQREKFIEEYSNKIKEYSQSLEDDAEKINLTNAVENADSVIPFMMEVTESKEDYTFNFYLPTKKEKSTLCDMILTGVIFNEDVTMRKNRKSGREPLSINDLKEIKYGFVPGHDIKFGSMELSKELYDEKRINGILETIQGDLKQGFQNTGLNNIGFKMKSSFEREFNGYSDKSVNICEIIKDGMKEGKVKEGEGKWTINDIRHLLDNHSQDLISNSELRNQLSELIPDMETQFKEIFINHLEKLGIKKSGFTSDEIIEIVSSSNPDMKEIPNEVRNAISVLYRGLEISKDTIYTEGKGKGTMYFLN